MVIKYSKSALKYLARQDRKTVDRIRAAIAGLTNRPPDGDIKPLQGYGDGRMRLRSGSCRIIFRYDEENEVEILLILDIGNRGDVYK